MVQTSLYNSAIRDNTVWQNEDVFRFEGTLQQLALHVPTFERWPLAFDHGDRRLVPVSLFEEGLVPGDTGINRLFDTVIRQPLQPNEQPIPVGIVSKTYALVQHREIFDALLKLLPEVKLDPAKLKAKMRITEYGTRMALRLVLAEKYAFDPGDGETLFLCLECLNSVDGSSRLRLNFSWLRLVCSNGLMVDHARISEFHRIHTSGLEISVVWDYIRDGLKQISKDKKRLVRWYSRPVTEEQVVRWVDGPLAKAWGSHVATRVYHIIIRGYDGDIADPFEQALPHERRLTNRLRVPGAITMGLNAYAVSQALSWLVGGRREIEDQFTRSRDINTLIEKLIRMN